MGPATSATSGRASAISWRSWRGWSSSAASPTGPVRRSPVRARAMSPSGGRRAEFGTKMSAYDGPYSGGHGPRGVHVTSARTDPAMTGRSSETQVSVLIGGLVVIVFGLAAVLTAIAMGWVGAVALGVVFLVV